MVNSNAESIDSSPFLLEHPTVREDIERVLSSHIPWGRLDGKTILVSGAAGMLPAAMVDVLMSARSGPQRIDLRVVGQVRSRERAELRFRRWLQNDGFSLVEQDVTQPGPSWLRPHMIVHAASQASPKFYRQDPVGTILPNVLGTLELLNLARRASTESFLYFSSAEIYGQVSGEISAINESTYGSLDPNDNRSCYGESKRMGEALCSAYALQYGVPAVIVRPFHTYGPGMRLDDGRVFADFVRDAVAGNEIVVKGEGREERSFCYLSDATEAYLRVLLCGQPGQAYNVGNPSESISIRGLARLIADLFPERQLQVNKPDRKSGDAVSEAARAMSPNTAATRPDISKINAMGWSPSTGLGDGFRRTVEYYLAASAG